MKQKAGLKPCPFCGEKVTLWDMDFYYGVVKVVGGRSGNA